jgi:O-antigen ligase
MYTLRLVLCPFSPLSSPIHLHLRPLDGSSFNFSIGPARSVRFSSRLASLQLIQIPAANRHVALILIHAPREALDVLRTGASLLLLLLLLGGVSISSLSIVEPVVHRLRIRVLCWLLVLVLCRRRRAAAAEEATDSVAD